MYVCAVILILLDHIQDEEEDSQKSDQFLLHFESELSEAVKILLLSKSNKHEENLEWPSFGKIQYTSIAEKGNASVDTKCSNKACLDENIRSIIEPTNLHRLPRFDSLSMKNLDILGIKSQIHSRLKITNQVSNEWLLIIR